MLHACCAVDTTGGHVLWSCSADMMHMDPVWLSRPCLDNRIGVLLLKWLVGVKMICPEGPVKATPCLMQKPARKVASSIISHCAAS